jgi:NTP pyrophosphatase (non-canonical NTP hydrolase)
MDMINDLVLEWAADRGILEVGTVDGQMNKLQEEFDELKDALQRKHQLDVADAIGDMQVVLIILAEMKGLCAYECLKGAYEIINQRKGTMANGVFVKEEDVA